MTEKPYSPGLEGVVAGTTAISEINPGRQTLAYRGYDIEELANRSTYEEVAYLILNGELPSRADLSQFTESLVSERAIPGQVYDILRKAPGHAVPMDALRTAVSFFGETDPDTGHNSHEANLRKATRLITKIATTVAAQHRIMSGLAPVPPSPKLPHAANLLYMITGREPAPFERRAFDASLILYAEHGFNASTFTARVIASTLSDIHSAVTGAIGALKGSLHGGANERVMDMLCEIGEAANAEDWVMKALASRQRIMGFGHRVYKSGDSRVPTLKKIGQELAEQTGEKKWVEIAGIVEGVMEREKRLYPNADFPCAYVYFTLGLPIRLYTPIFAASRIAGWAAHVIEQHDNNRLIRPDSVYQGKRNRAYVPVDQRG